MLPISLKGALVLTLRFAGGMLDVQCPETWHGATEHVTFRWSPLPTETTVVEEIVQWSPEGAGKDSLLSAGHTPKVLGAPPLGLLFRLLGGGLWSAVIRSPVFVRRRTTHHTVFLGFCPQRNQIWSGLGGQHVECPSLIPKKHFRFGESM